MYQAPNIVCQEVSIDFAATSGPQSWLNASDDSIANENDATNPARPLEIRPPATHSAPYVV
jgi:hypothetical protein